MHRHNSDTSSPRRRSTADPISRRPSSSLPFQLGVGAGAAETSSVASSSRRSRGSRRSQCSKGSGRRRQRVSAGVDEDEGGARGGDALNIWWSVEMTMEPSYSGVESSGGGGKERTKPKSLFSTRASSACTHSGGGGAPYSKSGGPSNKRLAKKVASESASSDPCRFDRLRAVDSKKVSLCVVGGARITEVTTGDTQRGLSPMPSPMMMPALIPPLPRSTAELDEDTLCLVFDRLV